VSRQYEASIDEVCWLVCKKGYLQRELPCFTDKSVFQLFRVFCLLAELNESDPPTVSSKNKLWELETKKNQLNHNKKLF
jgi:hypothetical protein